jgi:peptidoglycan/xylan/chitin deacetylase (PgdA/CDA1 family)
LEQQGKKPRQICWPNNAKLAVTFTIALELWSEKATPIPVQVSKVEDAKARGARVSPETEDLHAIDIVEYGGRRGIWRLIELFHRHDTPSTVIVSGRAAEKYPESVAELHRRGHEIAGHSYAQDIFPFLEFPQYGIKSELDNIRKSVSIIEGITGERPVGWFDSGGARGPDTYRLLCEEGFVWCADASDDDIPYLYRNSDGKELVIIPYQHEINDLSLVLTGKNPPYVYSKCFADAFDFLYEEGKAGDPKLLNATIHAHILARPWGAQAFENCLKYAKNFEDVWVTTRKEIAKWYLTSLK